MDPSTGKITTDSSAYSYTWGNEFGERQQTNDINYNPNGPLKDTANQRPELNGLRDWRRPQGDRR
jgi:hypothetical protein